jgi:hypothetical protein
MFDLTNINHDVLQVLLVDFVTFGKIYHCALPQRIERLLGISLCSPIAASVLLIPLQNRLSGEEGGVWVVDIEWDIIILGRIRYIFTGECLTYYKITKDS